VLACHLKPGDPARLPPDGRLGKEVLHFRTEDAALFRRRAEEALRWDQEKGAESGFAKLLVAEMVLRALLLCEGRPSLSTPTALSQLASEIRSRPGADWSSGEMARRCSLSIPQFSRKFRQAFGESPRQFVIRQRVRRAIHLLRESKLTIAEIAESLGYRDVFFFHRQFKGVARITPAEARAGAKPFHGNAECRPE